MSADTRRGFDPQKLRQIRRQQGIGQHTLAQQVGTLPTHISKCELGTRNPSLRMLVAIADALGTTVDQLLEDPHA